jgi:TPR repeat protein
MQTKAKTLVFAISFFLGTSSYAAADLFDDAIDAATRGDYARAIKLMRPLAEQGKASAQTFMGMMYDEGNVLPQDYQEAIKWYRLAAAQGEKMAQYNLGYKEIVKLPLVELDNRTVGDNHAAPVFKSPCFWIAPLARHDPLKEVTRVVNLAPEYIHQVIKGAPALFHHIAKIPERDFGHRATAL